MLSVSLVIVIIVGSLVFDYINGFHDAANAIAIAISTRALTPRKAVAISAVMNFFGAMYSTGVAKTIVNDIVFANRINLKVILAAIIGAIFWNLFTWWKGIPSSSSHALIGGLIGAILASSRVSVLKIKGIIKILQFLIYSPLIALTIAFCIMIAFFWMFGRWAPRDINRRFKKLQIVSVAMMAFSNGSNDAQKGMGIITLSLFSIGWLSNIEVPFWVKLAASLAMTAGTSMGGVKIIKTMSSKIFKLDSLSGFAADFSSSLIIFTATSLHLPVSTTHIVSCSIAGVGAAKRFNAVRWATIKKMFLAWIWTIPFSMVIGGLFYKIIEVLSSFFM